MPMTFDRKIIRVNGNYYRLAVPLQIVELFGTECVLFRVYDGRVEMIPNKKSFKMADFVKESVKSETGY
jgi:hypothetical protein